MCHRRAFLGSVIGGATGAVVAGAGAAATGRVLGSNERIRFGLIGGGSRGKEIFRAALRCPDVEAVAVADIYTRRLEEARAIVPGIATFKDRSSRTCIAVLNQRVGFGRFCGSSQEIRP